MKSPPIEIRGAHDLTLEVVDAVARERVPLVLHPDLLRRLTDDRARMTDAIARGARVYGVTTGAGYLAQVDIDGEAGGRHSRNLLIGRAVGSAPFLPAAEARAVMACRLASLVSGYSGVSAGLCRFLVDRLNDDFTPAIPRRAAGCAGEVIALSHAFQTFIGVGQVLDRDGRPQDAAAALAARGLGAYVPMAKEGIALLAGAPTTVAVTAARLFEGRALAGQLLVGAAASISAAAAPHDPYAPVVARLGGDPLLADVLVRIRALLGSARRRAGRSPQAPISFRVAPQVLTHVTRVLDRLEADVRRALAAVDDSPAFVDGEFVSTGAFHEIELAAGLDALALALAQAAELATQRVHRLLDGKFSVLPDQLTPEPGPRTGLIVVHKRMLGALNELRRLALPASLGISETSLGQEDAMTFSMEAAEKLRRAGELVREIVACELVVARQALWLRAEPIAPGLEDALADVIALVAPVDQDRPLGMDIARVIDLLAAGGAAIAPPGRRARVAAGSP